MSPFLLDVNVLLALHWRGHQAHLNAQDWFARKSSLGWATCPFTQAAFVRLLANPACSPDAVAPREAMKALEIALQHPSHCFWSDEIDFASAVQPFRRRIVGHRQVNDAYLLGLAIHKGGRLATLDRGLLALLPDDNEHRHRIELISSTFP